MKKLLIFSLLISSLGLMAQKKKKDNIEYFSDSEVTYSRWGVALNLDPVYTNRNLVDDPLIGADSTGFILSLDRAEGSFKFNYAVDFIYKIGQSFDISLGIGQAGSSWTYTEALAVIPNGAGFDTASASARVDVQILTIPLKLNFNTVISDVFELEVIPKFQLNFVQDYTRTVFPANSETIVTIDKNEADRTNYSVGIALGGNFLITENLGVFVHINGEYMVTPMFNGDAFMRETFYSFGLNTGIKYRF